MPLACDVDSFLFCRSRGWALTLDGLVGSVVTIQTDPGMLAAGPPCLGQGVSIAEDSGAMRRKQWTIGSLLTSVRPRQKSLTGGLTLGPKDDASYVEVDVRI